MIQYKSGGSIKDVDKSARMVVGYFTNTGSLDSDNDVFAKGAFDKTIKESGPTSKNRIWHLWQHDTYSPINKPKALKEDESGVYFETVIPKTAIGDLALELYMEKAITEHSVGFNTLKYEDTKEHRVIKEVRMWEGSSVLWGANENTPTLAVKSEEVMNRLGTLEKMLRDGSFQDDVFQLLTIEIEKLKKAICSLKPAEPLEPREAADNSDIFQILKHY